MTGETRYSAIVAWVKIALPLLALALLSSLFLLSRAPDPDAALSYAELDVERVIAEQRLTRPRFAGTLEDGRAVVLVAETIRQSPGATSQILLDSVTADVELAVDDAARLTAQGGRIDLAAQRADLSGGVRIGTDRGYDLTSDAVTLAIGDAFRLASPGPVTGTGPGVTFQAGAMDLAGPADAAVLHFTGGVRLLYGGQR